MFVILSSYTVPIAGIERLLGAHREFLEQHIDLLLGVLFLAAFLLTRRAAAREGLMEYAS